MAFEKDHPKLGGRKPGTPNKRTQEISDYANECGVSPALLLIDILSGKKKDLAGEAIEKDDYRWAIDTLMPYMYGKRKPVDSNGDDSDTVASLIEALSGSK